jgi:predicted RNA binding protein YcfA (HicA-like mRNA interferase family)
LTRLIRRLVLKRAYHGYTAKRALSLIGAKVKIHIRASPSDKVLRWVHYWFHRGAFAIWCWALRNTKCPEFSSHLSWSSKNTARQLNSFGTQNGSHLKVYPGGKRSIMPIHGGKREVKTGTVAAIKKQLGLK